MPKFIDLKTASKAGARYDDGKRVIPFLAKAPDPEAIKAKAEVDAQAALLQAIHSLRDAVASSKEQSVLPQILEAIERLQVAMKPTQPTKPSFGRLVFEHQRDADGKITSTVVTEK